MFSFFCFFAEEERERERERERVWRRCGTCCFGRARGGKGKRGDEVRDESEFGDLGCTWCCSDCSECLAHGVCCVISWEHVYSRELEALVKTVLQEREEGGTRKWIKTRRK